MRLLIIGADAAGMSAASRAKRNDPRHDVLVLEKTEDVSYSACGMPYNIADPQRPIEDLVVRHAHVFREKQGIDLRTGHIVKEIDTKNGKVRGTNTLARDFSFAYDKLLIATGAVPIRPSLPGFTLPGVMVLKNLNDGRLIKEFLKKKNVKKTIIVGMGYIALEMAESLRSRGIEVTMVKPRPRLLPWMNETLVEQIQKDLESHGVRVHAGIELEGIEESSTGLRIISKEKTFDAQIILVAVGVRPSSELAEKANLKLGPSQSISIDHFTRTSHHDIFAAGDCADSFHVVTGDKVWIPLALRANRSGWAAADNITGRESFLEGVAGTSVFKVFDLQVARSGLNVDEAKKAGFDPVERVIKASTRAHAHPGASPIWAQMVADKKTGKLIGAQLLSAEGAVHRINAVAIALHTKMTVSQFTQLDFACAPPFSPVWDPLLVAANQLLKDL